MFVKISRQIISYLKQQTRNREFGSSKFNELLVFYVFETSRSNYFIIITSEVKNTILVAIRKNRYNYIKTYFILATK